MLGGFPYISKVDLQGSKTFLAKLGIGSKEGLRTVESALDGGAGIGRITKGLLLDIAKNVDVVEPIAKFTATLGEATGVRSISNIGLEEWEPPAGTTYDLVWTQWCLGHLTDDEVILYLKRCKAALTPETGLVVVKENLNSGGEDLFDKLDSSVTRQVRTESSERIIRGKRILTEPRTKQLDATVSSWPCSRLLDCEW
ncbi:hypothetical protein RB594_005437 [Gaeumannomyces avenae]